MASVAGDPHSWKAHRSVHSGSRTTLDLQRNRKVQLSNQPKNITRSWCKQMWNAAMHSSDFKWPIKLGPSQEMFEAAKVGSVTSFDSLAALPLTWCPQNAGPVEQAFEHLEIATGPGVLTPCSCGYKMIVRQEACGLQQGCFNTPCWNMQHFDICFDMFWWYCLLLRRVAWRYSCWRWFCSWMTIKESTCAVGNLSWCRCQPSVLQICLGAARLVWSRRAGIADAWDMGPLQGWNLGFWPGILIALIP